MIRIVLPRRRGVLAIFLVALGPLVSAYFYLHGLRDHLLFLGLDPPVLVSASDRFIPKSGRTLFLACSDAASFVAPGLVTAPPGPEFPYGCSSVTAEGPVLPGQVFAMGSAGPFRFIAGNMQIADVTFPLRALRLALHAVPWLLALLVLFGCEQDAIRTSPSRTALPPTIRHASYAFVIIPLVITGIAVVLRSWTPLERMDLLVGTTIAALIFGGPLTRALLGAAHVFDTSGTFGRLLFTTVPSCIPAAGAAIVHLVMGALVLTSLITVTFATWYAILYAARAVLLMAFPEWIEPVLVRLM
ncbi:MAG: hypothetical protein AB7U75_07235 [Hyphomicrobiaceae bacterium]